jgi:hypothetical protein
MKYSLPTGEVVDIDIEDILSIDFTTIHGKQVMQEITIHKDYVKHWQDTDDADINDSLKFSDEPEPEEDAPYDVDIYQQVLKEKLD